MFSWIGLRQTGVLYRRQERFARHREAEHLPERILRLAGEALLAPVEDSRLPEPDPAEHAADEAAALAHPREDVEHPPVDEPEVADVDRDLDLGDPVEGTVEGRRRHPLEA